MTVGFTTAAALTIGSSQVKSLLGLKGSTNAFLESWMRVFTYYQETRLWDAVLGACTIFILLVLKVCSHFISISIKKFIRLKRFSNDFSLQNLKYKKSLRTIEDESVWQNECKKYLSLGRNAIVVIFGTLLAYILSVYGQNPFTLTGN